MKTPSTDHLFRVQGTVVHRDDTERLTSLSAREILSLQAQGANVLTQRWEDDRILLNRDSIVQMKAGPGSHLHAGVVEEFERDQLLLELRILETRC